jgi:RimJ/RimL family protein N-acetyltransferase
MRTQHSPPVRLPSGHLFDPGRPRSDGVLNAEELDWCRREGVPLAYDPAQTGWISLLGEDDIDPDAPETQWGGLHAPALLRLRPWRRDEAALMCALLDDPAVWRYLPEPYPGPLSAQLGAELIEVAAMQGHHEVRAVECGGVVVGQVRLLFDRHGADRRGAEISYWLGHAYWGHGIGTVLVHEATEEAFARHTVLECLRARVHPDNGASASVLLNAGYRPVRRDDGWLGFERRRA